MTPLKKISDITNKMGDSVKNDSKQSKIGENIMKMKFKTINGLILSLFACFQLCSCGVLAAGGVAAGAAGAAYVYSEGWVERNYTANVDQVYRASLNTAEKIGMIVETKTISVSAADIKAVKGDKEYWFKMEEKSKNMTTLSIREGVMGNKQTSQKIHTKIARLL